MANPAPIILFTYNRPWHTEQTLSALKHNELADQSDLFIFCDGAKDNSDQEKIEKVHNLIDSTNGFKSVTVKK